MYKCECGATYSKKKNIICRKCKTVTNIEIERIHRYVTHDNHETYKPSLISKRIKKIDPSNKVVVSYLKEEKRNYAYSTSKRSDKQKAFQSVPWYISKALEVHKQRNSLLNIQREILIKNGIKFKYN